MDVLVIDHRDSYTWNLVHLIAEVTGRLPNVVQHDEVNTSDMRSHSHIVLSPGPGQPDDPASFGLGPAILRCGRTPVLGVCLGLQGLVTVCGGQVAPVRPAHGEVATINHDGAGVFRGVPAGFRAVRYHSLAAIVIPPSLVVTARSEDGTVMGVRHRSRPLEGVQFHPESVLSEHGTQLIANFLGLG
ncbi:anthranilate synthase component II [Nocardia vaccinii]|uniref:anthranilate synthase component II n=1 Tax=Nocardia vaccinii TaxID=1822 RepID=UPI000836E16A|nr:aminodeoxychorismate/anthranilate synthase component II [Nocardia vaccinii]